MDPLLLMELLEVNPGWEVRVLADNKGIFIGHDLDFYTLQEVTDWEEEH